ncbi:MAG: hypothetical protein Kow00127_01530 [Bacteroidales bacterium]
MFLIGCRRVPSSVEVVQLEAHKPEDILDFRDSLVSPVAYDIRFQLDTIPVMERKELFIRIMLPAILVERYRLLIDFHRLERLAIKSPKKYSRSDRLFLERLRKIYHTSDFGELEQKVFPHPVSIALAQAAIESGWGTSRFFREGNNPFGIWSFDQSRPRMPAGNTRGDDTVYVRRYHNISDAVHDYFLILANGPYQKFRAARLRGEDINQLLFYLDNYSEDGRVYGQKINDVIRHNRLNAYNLYSLDPDRIKSRWVPVWKQP